MKAAVICAEGLGDSLNMMIASYQLAQKGYQVTTFSHQLPTLHFWLPKDLAFEKKPDISLYEKVFAPFDLIVLQHENSHRAKMVRFLAQEQKIKLVTFYNNYRKSKHGPLEENDFVFDESIPMAGNVAVAIQKYLGLASPCKEIGLVPPSGLHHRSKKRVVLHPTSSRKEKNWTRKGFVSLAKKLQKSGFEPLIAVKEYDEWKEVKNHGIDLPRISSLQDLADLLYESSYFIGNDSGPGHLASYLEIPSLIISPYDHISHWQPGWLPCTIVRPYPLAINIKGFRMKEKWWPYFLPVYKVFSFFSSLKKSYPIQ